MAVEEPEETLTKISELADQIYTLAAPFNRRERHPISDAAKLIQWVCYRYSHPDDPEAEQAIAGLRKALGGSE